MRLTTILVSFVILLGACCSNDSSGENAAGNDTIMARRSVRNYLETPVEHSKLEQIALCGVNAPSAVNQQKWAVRIVESKEWIDGVNAIAIEKNGRPMFFNAPNVIVVAHPNERWTEFDSALLCENMVIAAQGLGLGTCYLGGPVQMLLNTPELKPYLDKLNIPEGYQINIMISIGYPAESPASKPRDLTKVEYI